MSKVIRAAIWQEEPQRIEVPAAPVIMRPDKGGDAAPEEVSEEQMLEDIAAKMQQADARMKEAEKVLQEAQAERDRILAEAEKEAGSVREQARQEGHAEGLAAGREEGAAAVREEMKQGLLESNEKAMQTLKTAREAADDYMSRAEQDVAKIVMQVVEKVLPQHFIDVPQVILPVVREAILKVRDQKEINVHVPAESYEMVLMARDEYRGLLTDGTAILEVTSDESLQPGDCVIETPNGGVDARLMTQVELLRQAIQGVLS